MGLPAKGIFLRASNRKELMIRYHWTEPNGSPPRIELIDDFTLAQVAVILGDRSGKWHWSRYTNLALHGALPQYGTTTTLDEAKRAVVTDLPNAPKN